MPIFNQKGAIHFLIPLLLLAGIIGGVYLVTNGNPLKIFSKATNPPIVFKSSSGQVLPANSQGIPQTTSASIKIELTSTLGPPVFVTPSSSPAPTASPAPTQIPAAGPPANGAVSCNENNVASFTWTAGSFPGKTISNYTLRINKYPIEWTPDSSTPATTAVDGDRAIQTGSVTAIQVALTEGTYLNWTLQPGFSDGTVGELYPGGNEFRCSPVYQTLGVNTSVVPPANQTAGTVSYKIAENPADLDRATAVAYTHDPMVLDYTFADSTAGQKFIWVEFRDVAGTTDRRSAQIEIIAPGGGTSGGFGKAIKFNNDTSNTAYASVAGTGLLSGNPFTVEAWVKSYQPSSGNYLRSYSIIHYSNPPLPFIASGYIFRLGSEIQERSGTSRPSFEALLNGWTDSLNGHLAYIRTDQESGGGITLRPDRWYHIATSSYSEGNKCFLKMYVDGVQIAGTERLSPDGGSCQISTNLPQNLILAKNVSGTGGTSGYYFNGQIDELRISNTVRYTTNFTPSNSPFSPDANTLALYHFDGSVNDSSGNANNGNAVGPVEYVDSSVPAVTTSPSPIPSPSSVLSPSPTPTAQPRPAGNVKITVKREPRTPNRLTVEWSNLSGAVEKDWAGLFKKEDPSDPSHMREWLFLGSCSRTSAGKVPVSSGKCDMNMRSKLPVGNFELRLMTDNTYNVIARSNTIRIFTASP